MKTIVFILLFIRFPLSCFSQNWDTLGIGVSGTIRCLYSDSISSKIYAGGDFIFAGGVKSRGVASWNGISWDSLRSGMDGHSDSSFPNNTLSITRFGNRLYFGGAFYTVDDLPVRNLASWNGSEWDSINHDFNASIGKLKVINGELYACGVFDSVGGILANGLAKFNGSVWSDVNMLPDLNIDSNSYNTISDVEKYGNELFVSGIFYGDSSKTHMVRWDGSSWKSVGNGILGGFFYWVNCMTIFQNELYVGGLFSKADGNAGNSIMRWDGSTWNDVGNGVGGIQYPQVRAMSVINDQLYVIGNFLTAGNHNSPGIASWDGNNWCSIESNFNSGALALELFHDSLIVGGYFDPINTNAVNNISKKCLAIIEDTCQFHIGINEISAFECSIFPNPSSNKLNIEIDIGLIQEISIFNLTGKQICTISCNTSKQEIDISTLSPGLYFLDVISDQRTFRKRFVKN